MRLHITADIQNLTYVETCKIGDGCFYKKEFEFCEIHFLHFSVFNTHKGAKFDGGGRI